MTVEEQLKAQQTQLSLLTAQNGELAARLTLQALQQGKEAELARLMASRDKDLANAEFARDKAQVLAAFGKAQGLKEGLANAMPAGREGSLTLAKGAEGTQLLGGKRPLLMALGRLAASLVEALPKAPPRWVVATATEAEAAQRATAAAAQLKRCAEALAAAGVGARPPFVEILAGGAAALQSGMTLLGALSDAGRFFRVDRQMALFDAGEEAQRVFELLLQRRGKADGPPHIERLATNLDVAGRAAALYDDWLALDHAQRSAAPDKPAAAHARMLLDLIDPASKPDAFWALATGLAKAKRLVGVGRIETRVTGQAMQLQERRAWRSDELKVLATAQLEYSLFDEQGKLLESRVELDSAAALELSLDAGVQQLRVPE